MALTPDEQQRILDEERAHNSARKQIKREENQRKNKKIMMWLGIFFVVGMIWAAYNQSNRMAPSSSTESQASGTNTTGPASIRQIPYEILREWSIPNGGFGRDILVSSKYRNERDLKDLGLNLKYLARNDRNSTITVFDNKKAASYFRKGPDLNNQQGDFLDKHIVGIYTKNINTGYHKFQISVNGVNSKIVTVDY